jgi:hypothetical protein
MKVIIPSKGRPDIISTHLLFKDYLIVVPTNEVEDYKKNKTIDPSKIIASDAESGIANARNWILENLIEEGEWFVFSDDNQKYFTAVDEENYKLPFCLDQTAFENRIDEDRFWKIIEDTIKEAERVGAKYCGFATVDDAYFRRRKFRYMGYCMTEISAVQKNSLRFNPLFSVIDDYEYTASNLLRFGRVVINNYMMPKTKHYEKGGIGTYEERLPHKIKACRLLMLKYPGLFRYKIKSGCHPKAEIQVRFNSVKQVDKWRKEYRA